MKRLIRKADVRAKLNVGNTKLHEMIRSGDFPAPIKLSTLSGKPGRTSYWSADIVDAWIDAQVRAGYQNALRNRGNDPFGRPSNGASS